MVPRQDDFLKLRNHREVRNLLEQLAAGADLSWFDRAAVTICKRWFRLAQQHLRVANQLLVSRRHWRSTVSRCYYAVYCSSKSVRYYVTGSVKLDAEDHKYIGDLPNDFPSRSHWSNFAVELRRDRNLADYEPWNHVRRSLTYAPGDAFDNPGRGSEGGQACVIVLFLFLSRQSDQVYGCWLRKACSIPSRNGSQDVRCRGQSARRRARARRNNCQTGQANFC